MRLSELQGEEALDVLADIIEPASEILADSEVSSILKGSGKKLTAAKVILKNHKKAVIEILAAMERTPVEEFQVNVLTLPVKLLDVLNDKTLMEAFGLQSQTKEKPSSGSALENTEGGAQ